MDVDGVSTTYAEAKRIFLLLSTTFIRVTSVRFRKIYRAENFHKNKIPQVYLLTMIFRAFTLFSLASATLAAEAKLLRTTKPEDPALAYTDSVHVKDQVNPLAYTDYIYEDKTEEMNSYIDPANDDESDTIVYDDEKNGSFSVMQGVNCTGGFNKTAAGMTKHCEAGMKKEFSMKKSAQEMNQDIGSMLMDQFQGIMPESSQLVLSNDEVENLLMDENGELDASKTVEFGGSMKLDWGCKLSFEGTKDEGFSKKVECGLKADSSVGKKSGKGSVLEYSL
eukprot:scaffold26751_cov147-Cylindrotheca_fusiformis.AAC.4